MKIKITIQSEKISEQPGYGQWDDVYEQIFANYDGEVDIKAIIAVANKLPFPNNSNDMIERAYKLVEENRK